MGFKIGDNNSVNKGITLEQLTAGLDSVKDKKKIARIEIIFNEYNKNKSNESEAKVLDIDEQVALRNDLHKADGDGKGKDFDGKISARGLKKAGLAGEYKAYKDFFEAYQKALGETSSNTHVLTFQDRTINDGENLLLKTSVKGTEDGITEQRQYINNEKEKDYLTKQNANGENSTYDQFERLTKQITSDKQEIIYSMHDSNAKDAQPRRVVVYDKDNNRTALELQQDGIYLNKEDNTLYKLNDKGIPEKYTPPEVEPEVVDEVVPEVIIEKQERPTARKLIKMTAGWKNQKVKPDADTTAKFNAMFKADEVLAELVNRNEAFKDEAFTDELLADLIKNNPSVFNSEGIIYSNADWNKLDFPSDLSRYKK